MKLEHNSRKSVYRNPVGAVKTGTNVRIRLAVTEIGLPDSIELIMYRDGVKTVKEMHYIEYLCECSVYEANIDVGDKPGIIWYYFKVAGSGQCAYYGNNYMNLGGIGQIYEDAPNFSYQITVYEKDYKTPDWFKNSVAYQIFVDRFYNPNGEVKTDRTDIIKRKWGDTPYYKAEQFGGEYLSNDFFGGTLEGVRRKLPYIADLGIKVIYLNPIFKAYSNHKYDTGDYKTIDPMFGTEEDFKNLCKEADKLGIRIILDGVFNHTGSNSKYFNKDGEYDSVGAYQSKDSKYYSWYRFMDYPKTYESWWGMNTLPQIEEKSKEFRDYILHDNNSVVKRWLKMGASGWRLDVVDELPGFFVKELRKEVKTQKNDAVIIGEVWEDASNKVSYGEQREYFLGKELDSVMNYPFRNMLLDFALGRINAELFDERLMSLKENYPPQAFYSLLNFLSSHDIERILTMLGNVPDRHSVNKDFQASFKLDEHSFNQAKLRLNVVLCMLMTMPGVPCIFYGDEAGVQGYGDPFCRCTYPWGKENKEILAMYKKYIALRNGNKIYRTGEYETIYKVDRVYAYMRSCGLDRRVVLACMSKKPERARLDLARFGVECLIDDEGTEYTSNNGIFFVDMERYSTKIFNVKYKSKKQ